MVSVFGGGFTAKYGGKVGEKTAVSLGGITFMDFYQELDRPLAIGFFNVTRGDENKHFTLNVGLSNQVSDRIVSYDWSSYTTNTDQWGNVDYSPAGQTREYLNLMLLNFSGMTPLTTNRWLITENYLLIPAFRRTQYEAYSNYYGFGYEGYQPYVYNNPSNDNVGILALGIRSYNQRSGWLWDYGMAGVIGDGFGFPVPWFSFTLEF
jgi:hypothetical protein